MRLAERALREEATPVAVVGQSLGYISESAFSNAFKRVTGHSTQGEFTIGTNGVGFVEAVSRDVWHIKPGQRVLISSHFVARDNVDDPGQILIGLTAGAGADAMLDMREKQRELPDIAEPVIGRAFARPVGSSGHHAAGVDGACNCRWTPATL
jgi:hypothetical protein